MRNTHDALTAPHADTPAWFVWSARLLPVGILSQFLSAGLGLFQNPAVLGLHGGVGTALAALPLALLAGSLAIPRLRGFAWWAAAVTALFTAQIALAAGGNPLPLAFHPLNGALLLVASLVLVTKIQRRAAKTVVA